MSYFIPISTFNFACGVAHNTYSSWALPTLDLFGPANIFPSQIWEIVTCRYEPNFIQPQYHHSPFFYFVFFVSQQLRNSVFV